MKFGKFEGALTNVKSRKLPKKPYYSLKMELSASVDKLDVQKVKFLKKFMDKNPHLKKLYIDIDMDLFKGTTMTLIEKAMEVALSPAKKIDLP